MDTFKWFEKDLEAARKRDANNNDNDSDSDRTLTEDQGFDYSIYFGGNAVTPALRRLEIYQDNPLVLYPVTSPPQHVQPQPTSSRKSFGQDIHAKPRRLRKILKPSPPTEKPLFWINGPSPTVTPSSKFEMPSFGSEKMDSILKELGLQNDLTILQGPEGVVDLGGGGRLRRRGSRSNLAPAAERGGPTDETRMASAIPCPRAVLIPRSNSHPFQERVLQLDVGVKIGRSVARSRPTSSNAIFDCKVLSRNHALLWFEGGKFYLQDTKSSNGTFVNNARLSKSSEESFPRELASGDLVQFGVDVMEATKKVTHGCIVAQIILYLPDGKEAKASPASPTIDKNVVATSSELYQLNQYLREMAQREKTLEGKLAALNKLMEPTRLSAEMGFKSLIEEDRLLSRIEVLEHQLQSCHKSTTDENLREQVTQLYEEKEVYQGVAKETLLKAVQEKLSILQKCQDLERNLSGTKEEMSALGSTLEQNSKELLALAEKYDASEKEAKGLREELERAKHRLEESNVQTNNNNDTFREFIYSNNTESDGSDFEATQLNEAFNETRDSEDSSNSTMMNETLGFGCDLEQTAFNTKVEDVVSSPNAQVSTVKGNETLEGSVKKSENEDIMILYAKMRKMLDELTSTKKDRKQNLEECTRLKEVMGELMHAIGQDESTAGKELVSNGTDSLGSSQEVKEEEVSFEDGFEHGLETSGGDDASQVNPGTGSEVQGFNRASDETSNISTDVIDANNMSPPNKSSTTPSAEEFSASDLSFVSCNPDSSADGSFASLPNSSPDGSFASALNSTSSSEAPSLSRAAAIEPHPHALMKSLLELEAELAIYKDRYAESVSEVARLQRMVQNQQDEPSLFDLIQVRYLVPLGILFFAILLAFHQVFGFGSCS